MGPGFGFGFGFSGFKVNRVEELVFVWLAKHIPQSKHH